MKPFLSVKANVNILAGQPFDKIVARLMHRHPAASAAVTYPLRVALILLLEGSLCGTTAISIRTRTVLVVGADSYVRRGDGKQLDPTCKIRPYGRFYASFAGWASDEDTGYDVYKIASGAVSKCSTIKCATENFKRDVRIPLLKSLTLTRSRDGENFFIENMVKIAPLQALIYGLEQNTAGIRMLSFNVDRTKLALGQLDLTIDDDGGCPGTCGPQGFAFNGIGSYFLAADHFNAHIKTAKTIPARQTAIRIIANGLAAEAKAAPKKVGLPYSILVIEGGKVRWQEGYQGICPAIGK